MQLLRVIVSQDVHTVLARIRQLPVFPIFAQLPVHFWQFLPVILILYPFKKEKTRINQFFGKYTTKNKKTNKLKKNPGRDFTHPHTSEFFSDFFNLTKPLKPRLSVFRPVKVVPRCRYPQNPNGWKLTGFATFIIGDTNLRYVIVKYLWCKLLLSKSVSKRLTVCMCCWCFKVSTASIERTTTITCLTL